MSTLPVPTRNCLCKTFRAAGLPKQRALTLTNEVEKWYRASGVEWTVDRLKNLHHWYITMLSGKPNIPPWIARKGGKPKGPFRWAFEMKNRQCALAVLSCHTVFIHRKVTLLQRQKLEEGLNAREVPLIHIKSRKSGLDIRKIPKLVYESPTLQALTGVSIPVGFGVVNLSSPNRKKVAEAYMGSWRWLGDETFSFLKHANLLHHAPPVLSERTGTTRAPVGRMTALQEPSLKVRWISNPNRITQHFLRPLQYGWREWLKLFPTDCTTNQKLGVLWAESKLGKGITLTATDLSSSTDKLNLIPCLDFVHWHICGHQLADNAKIWGASEVGSLYVKSLIHFIEVSRGGWVDKDGKICKWQVGWPLGTAPSFNLLALTNNCCGFAAAVEVGLPWTDSFRVIGDDIVMDARLFPAYAKSIQRLGGEFNPSKVITSAKAVEFAGRVITPKQSYLKRVKSRDLSDDSFMEIMSLMGEQAKSLLKPRQRKVWNELKFVPGVAVSGPYSQDSFGESLALRYQWYLEHVESKRIEPDKTLKTGGQMAIDLVICLEEMGLAGHVIKDHVVPIDIWEGIHPSKTAYMNAVSGDPRRVDGKTALEVGEDILEKDTFKSFHAFKEEELTNHQSSVELTSTQPPSPSKPRHMSKGRGR